MPDDPTPPRKGAFRRAGKPSLPLALAKVAGANLVDMVAPGWADRTAEGVMQDYADQGGDPGAHATLFGLAAAGGATLPPALMALGGASGMRSPKPRGVESFLRTLDTSPVDPSIVGVVRPIEYIRPGMRGASAGSQKLAASVLALLSARSSPRPASE